MSQRKLPIWEHQEEILEALREHSVLIITSPTGTGKTTQVPLMLLQSDLLPQDKAIGITQPRRIAATSVSAHVAQQMGVSLSEEVGYKIRFDDQTGPQTRLKFMTDGVLLMEAQSNPNLDRYGIIIIDEAHERSQNIDFSLGFLKKLLNGPRRDDLKVVVMSATIQPRFFSRYFDNAPMIEATAPMHPVEVRYRPYEVRERGALGTMVAEQVVKVHQTGEPGDVLVFLPGVATIWDSIKEIEERIPTGIKTIPLFARLSAEEQNLVFKKFPGKRKVICSTNLAETSVTVEGIRTVIDSGRVKVNDFMPRSGIGVLREIPASIASIDQRKGRAGRTAPGLCVRLFEHDSLDERDQFSRPQILRSDLSEIVLRLAGMGVQDVRDFPFPTRPSRADLDSAYRILTMIGAIDESSKITDTGRFLLHFPLSPRMGRMILEAANSAPEILEEILIYAAFLSTKQPYPSFQDRDENDRYRGRIERRFGHSLGDGLTHIRVFRGYERSGRSTSFCKEWEFDERAMDEIANIYDQLKDICTAHDVTVLGGGSYKDMVRCLVAAYPPFVLRKGRGKRYGNVMVQNVQIHPTSNLFHAPPEYIVAGEIFQTRRTFAQSICRVDRRLIKDLNLMEFLPRLDDDTRLPKSEGRRRRKVRWLEKKGGGRNHKKKRR